MWKKLATLSGAGLLMLAGCGAETKTTVANTVSFPDEANDQTSDDQDGNGEIEAKDNSFAGLAQNPILVNAGLDLNGLLQGAVTAGTLAIGLDISSKNFANDDKKAGLDAFLADLGGVTPKFDGKDKLTVSGDVFSFKGVKITNGVLTTDASDFVLAIPFDPANPTALPLNNAKITGTMAKGDASLTNARITGFIKAEDFADGYSAVGALIQGFANTDASALNGGGAPVQCSNDAACDAALGAGTGVCTEQDGLNGNTGVCVTPGGTADGIFSNGLGGLIPVDTNKNGLVEVKFNKAAGKFDINELSALFDFDKGAAVAVSGLLGAVIFQLELDGNIGGPDAAGVGVLFTSVAATE